VRNRANVDDELDLGDALPMLDLSLPRDAVLLITGLSCNVRILGDLGCTTTSSCASRKAKSLKNPPPPSLSLLSCVVATGGEW
jgi:hypothetical protein